MGDATRVTEHSECQCAVPVFPRLEALANCRDGPPVVCPAEGGQCEQSGLVILKQGSKAVHILWLKLPSVCRELPLVPLVPVAVEGLIPAWVSGRIIRFCRRQPRFAAGEHAHGEKVLHHRSHMHSRPAHHGKPPRCVPPAISVNACNVPALASQSSAHGAPGRCTPQGTAPGVALRWEASGTVASMAAMPYSLTAAPGRL